MMGASKNKVIEFVSLAYQKREHQILEDASTNAYRLFCGENEGIPGFVVEQYADFVLFQNFEGISTLNETELLEIAEWYLKNTKTTSVYLKPFHQNRSDKRVEELKEKLRLLKGSPASESVLIKEHGLQFILKPNEGFSNGIFLDQRENRFWLSRGCSGKRVLNCFAYTGAFSVYAAKEGAVTTSVDVSKKYLEWAKENFLTNGLNPNQHQFFASDVFFHFKKALKAESQYDLIILDPPSFSRNKDGVVFSVKKDMSRLVDAAVSVLSSGGKVFVSSNYAEWNSQDLSEICEEVFQEKGLNMTKLSTPLPPFDFRNQETQLSVVFYQRD